MLYYTVKEIAEMLHINQETVRRWIRDGKLQAERGVGRQGSKVEESVLKEFLEKNKNFSTATSIGVIGAGVASIVNGFAGGIGFAQSTISAISSSKIRNIISSKDKGRKEMYKELEAQKLELEKLAMDIKLDIARQQNELRTLEEQIKIIDETINRK